MHHKVAIFISETMVILEEEGTLFRGGQGLSTRPIPIIEVAKKREADQVSRRT